jgi:hypothetical protein
MQELGARKTEHKREHMGNPDVLNKKAVLPLRRSSGQRISKAATKGRALAGRKMGIPTTARPTGNLGKKPPVMVDSVPMWTES